jgi:copper chaperone
MTKTIINVDGMSCEHCVKAVTGAISALSGVSSVLVSLENNTATVEYDASASSLEAIKAAIVEEGYDIAA